MHIQSFIAHFLVISIGFVSFFLTTNLLAQDPIRPEKPLENADVVLSNLENQVTAEGVWYYTDLMTWAIEHDKISLHQFEEYAQKLRKISCKADQCQTLTASQTLMEGIAQHFRGNTDKMDSCFALILQNIDQYSSDDLIKYLNTPGSFYYNHKEYKKAIPYFAKTADIFSKNKEYSSLIASNINTLALCYMHEAKEDSAIQLFRQGIQISQKGRDAVWYGLISGNLASLLIKKERYREAIPLLKIDAKTSLKSGMYISAANAYAGLGQCYIHLNELDSAALFLDTAYQITLPFPLEMKSRQNIYKIYIEFYEKDNKKDSVIFYYQNLIEISDSIYQKNKRKELEELKYQYKKVDDAKAIETLKKEQSLNNWIFILLMAILIILAIGFLLLIRNQYKLKSQKNALESSNKIKDKLFSIIGHDLRSPVASLSGMLSLLEIDLVTQEEFKSFIPDLKRKFHALNDTLENLLSWSKNQIKYSKPDIKPNVLADVIDNICNLYHDIAKSKSIKLSKEIESDLAVMCDKNQITIVIRNFVNNAIKFTDNGGGVVVKMKEVKGEVLISVSDTGIGLSEEQISRIMDHQEVVSTKGTQGEKGTGIGLMLCTEMIDKNEGRFWVESQKDKGTTFYFTLPKAARH